MQGLSLTWTWSLREIAIIILAIILSSCSTAPNLISEKELKKTTQIDFQNYRQSIYPLGETLSLEEATARALKYNLDHRVTIMRQVLASGQLKAGKFDMLPSLLARAGYSWRDSDHNRLTIDGLSSVSSERSHVTGDLSFSWSMLDFSLGYYSSKANADKSLIALEQRRRSTHNLIQKVNKLYWMALAAQELQPAIQETISKAEHALDNSRRIVKASVKSPVSALAYQRALLENIRLLEAINSNMVVANTELAGLIGAQPGSILKLAVPVRWQPGDLLVRTAQLEEIALANNAELKISHYEARLARINARISLLKLFPNLSFDYGVNHDEDKFLVNNSWQNAGLQLSHNMINLIALPTKRKQSKLQVELANTRRAAMQMSVLTQVNLSVRNYESLLKQYNRADDIVAVDISLSRLKSRQAQSATTSELDNISSKVTEILSQTRRFDALAKVHEARGKLVATLGLDPKIGNLDDAKVMEIRDYFKGYKPGDNLFSIPVQRKPLFATVIDVPLLKPKTMPKPKVLNKNEAKIKSKTKSKNVKAPSRNKNNYWIQFGAFKSRKNADKYEQETTMLLGRRGVDSPMTVVFREGLFRVELGPLSQKDASDKAESINRHLKSKVIISRR